MKKMTEQEYMDREAKYGAHNYHPLPVVLEKGEGIYVWDVNGKRYFDFSVGLFCREPRTLPPEDCRGNDGASQKVSFDFGLSIITCWVNGKNILLNISGYDKVLPMNSGAEADETALKLCRRWGYDVEGIPADQAKIIVCDNNFHGRTITIVTLSNDPSSYAGFGPLLPDS